MAISPSPHVRHNPEPRMTANELARYMISGDAGRLGIIRRSRDSGTPSRTRYKDVKMALRAALADPAGERRILAEAGNVLNQRSTDASRSTFVRDDALKSLDVLNAFAQMRNQLAGFDYIAPLARQTPLVISGVEVPVTLDLLIHRASPDGEEIGGLLFRLTQSDEGETENAASKRKDMGLYAATLVRMHVAAHLAGNRLPAYPLCWSVDVQCGDIHVAPRTYAVRARNLEAACRFIAAMWHTA